MRWFRKKAPAVARPRSSRLLVEQLEDRRLLTVTYHGGVLLPHVEVEGAYYGQYWNTATGMQQSSELNNYLAFLTNSSYMDMLGEYSVGRGSLVDNGIAEATASGATVDNSTIQQMLASDIASGNLQAPDANRLYIVYTAPNVDVTYGNQDSLHDFYGYHNSFVDAAGQAVYYAVIAHPIGNGDFPGLNDFQTLTRVTSHELAEAATDPDGNGWYDDQNGEEIGDLANALNDMGVLNGYVVQAEWSVRQNAPVLPPDAQPLPPSQTSLPLALAYVGNQFTHSAEYDWNLVANDYERYLGRAGSPLEISSWVTGMEQGLTAEQVLAGFVSSPEYYVRAGGTDQAWIERLYVDLLHRPADPQGEQGWLGILAAGQSRAVVAYGIVTSAERERLLIIADYESYLGREPSALEVTGWINTFHQGITNAQIVASFVASTEYYQGQGGTVETWLKSIYNTILGRAPDQLGFNDWEEYLKAITQGTA